MLIRIIAYVVCFITVVYADLRLIKRFPNAFSVTWEKTTLYSVSFVMYILWCYGADYVFTVGGL